MASLLQVIVFSAIGGVLSLVGGLFLLSSKKRAVKLARFATPFAAGALLAAAFMDLLPEAVKTGNADSALMAVLFGIVGFFLLERFLRFFHHHHDDNSAKHTDPTASLVIIGDTIHNFIDGIAIAAGFLVDTPTGIIVTLAVAAHEIPQEIGDFGLLLSKGMSRQKVLLFNFFSAMATVIAAIIFFQIGQETLTNLDVILGLVAGFFVYIAVSDIIPSIHANEQKVLAGPQTFLLISGLIIVGLVTSSLHDLIDTHDHDNEDEHSQTLQIDGSDNESQIYSDTDHSDLDDDPHDDDHQHQ